jgi:hypothetical protein
VFFIGASVRSSVHSISEAFPEEGDRILERFFEDVPTVNRREDRKKPTHVPEAKLRIIP